MKAWGLESALGHPHPENSRTLSKLQFSDKGPQRQSSAEWSSTGSWRGGGGRTEHADRQPQPLILVFLCQRAVLIWAASLRVLPLVDGDCNDARPVNSQQGRGL